LSPPDCNFDSKQKTSKTNGGMTVSQLRPFGFTRCITQTVAQAQRRLCYLWGKNCGTGEDLSIVLGAPQASMFGKASVPTWNSESISTDNVG
jgi:hypothetical protein